MIFKVKKSYFLTAINVAAHAGALLVDLVLPIEEWQKFGLAVLIVTSWWWQERYGVGTWTGEFKLGEDNSCALIMNDGRQSYGVTQGSVHPGFIRLSLRGIGRRTRLQLVPRDSVEPETYRILRTLIVQRRFAAAIRKT